MSVYNVFAKTPKQKEFLRKLADLIEEYDVTIDLMDSTSDSRLRVRCGNTPVMVEKFTYGPKVINAIRETI